ncbi:hypothetical protein ACJIZ3_020743 [Penstemon smallii]|uniref:PARP-type domain-containing protein n=1 Tax=Penstemon smallii TaxID=265156 RepID=A0ABD3SJK9_9LAMI
MLRTHSGTTLRIACPAACKPPRKEYCEASTAVFTDCGTRTQTAYYQISIIVPATHRCNQEGKVPQYPKLGCFFSIYGENQTK